jgi:hypothetical protein
MSVNTEGLGIFELSINDMPITSGLNLFREGTIQSGVGLSIPIAKFIFVDHHGTLVGDQALNDGTKISVVMGRDTENSVSYDFLVYSINSYEEGGANVQEVYCLLDKPPLTTGASKSVHSGTSSQVLSEISSESNMLFDGPSTEDNMTWINCGGTRLQFMDKVCLRSYRSDNSCMSHVVDFDTVILKDLFEIFSGVPSHNLHYSINSNAADTGIKVELDESKPCSRTGFYNQATNYGHRHWQHSLTGDVMEFSTINPKVLGAGLPINSQIKGNLEFASLTVGSNFDTGGGSLPGANVHTNYHKAKYQNLRYLSLFSEGVRVLTREFVNIPLFSLVSYLHGSIRDSSTVPNRKYSGNYIVGSKTLVLRGKHYAETYEMYRPFITETGNTPTVGSEKKSDSYIKRESNKDAIENSADALREETNVSPSGNKIVPDPHTDPSKLNVESQINTSLGGSSTEGISLFSETESILHENTKEAEIKLGKLGDTPDLDFLSEKYGTDYDKIDALMSEFQSALKRLDLCKALSSLENLSVSFTMDINNGIIGILEERERIINRALDKNVKSINDLIAKGGIPDSFLSPPTVSSKCNEKTASDINNILKGILPNKCLDKRDISKLNSSNLKLSQKLRKLQSQLQDLLCAFGIGS